MKKMCPRCGKRKIDKKEKYCLKCMEEYTVQKRNEYKAYNKRRREDEEYKRFIKFYNSKEWRESRDSTVREQNGFCLVCFALDEGINIINPIDITSNLGYGAGYYEAVHHIIELKENYELRIDKRNLICLCESHHKKVHNEYLNGNKRFIQSMLLNILKWYHQEYLVFQLFDN